MKIFNYILLLFVTFFGFCLNIQAEEKFGRFFTTPQQRQNLDELRNHQPEELVVEIAEDDFAEETREEEQLPVDVVRLRGLVYRQNGKSTAWLNEGNTYEGDIGSQYIDVDGISTKGVLLDISGDETKIELKAGQAYEPAKKKIHGVIRE